MGKATAAVALLVATLLAGCSGSPNRSLARYYDPQGLFSTDLPAANTLTVAPASQNQAGPSVLSGVLAAPPQPSPTPSDQFGSGLGGMAGAQPTDQTMYQVLVVTTDAFDSVGSMTSAFLTSDPAIDVREERGVTVGGDAGRLVVADIVRQGAPQAGIAAAFTLGHEGVGYILAAIFPPGSWSGEEGDFLRVLASFRAGVPPGLRSFPLSTG